jgi:hypothetical protein
MEKKSKMALEPGSEDYFPLKAVLGGYSAIGSIHIIH